MDKKATSGSFMSRVEAFREVVFTHLALGLAMGRIADLDREAGKNQEGGEKVGMAFLV